MRSLGLIFLGAWLIVTQVAALANIHFSYDKIIFAGLALLAGSLLLIQSIKSKLGDIGTLLLSLWLLLQTSMGLFKFNFQYSGMILEILGIAAGVFLVIRK
jgi:hypothetical protein